MKYKCISLAVLLVVSAASFASTNTIECTYTKYSDPSGNHNVENIFVLRYLIDPEANKVYVLGNNGSNEVAKISGNKHVSFVEVTSVGNVMVTTMVADTMESVHSRNTVGFGNELIPSQYYGKCVGK